MLTNVSMMKRFRDLLCSNPTLKIASRVATLRTGAASLGVFTLFAAIHPAGLTAQENTSSLLRNAEGQVVQSAEVDAYWTPERLLSAKPIEAQLRAAADGLPMGITENRPANETAQKGNGSTPLVKGDPGMAQTIIPASALSAFEEQAVDNYLAIPDATSSFGAHFTTTRVFPDAATVAYPYRTAGKLFFTDPRTRGNFVCSASVLRPRIIVTAGHCIAHPSTSASGRYFYSNYSFVPAYRNGIAPYGTWSPSIVWVTNTWYHSDGSVPNAQDVGMLVARDQRTKIGYITGWLGYYTNQLGNNNVTMLGYPCNLDSCARMEETFAQTYDSGGNNTYIYGSAMRGGSSGGPWVQDFGVNPAGAPAGLLANNYLVAVTSYGPVSTTPKYQGASNLDSRFLTLLHDACGAATSGNCQ